MEMLSVYMLKLKWLYSNLDLISGEDSVMIIKILDSTGVLTQEEYQVIDRVYEDLSRRLKGSLTDDGHARRG